MYHNDECDNDLRLSDQPKISNISRFQREKSAAHVTKWLERLVVSNFFDFDHWKVEKIVRSRYFFLVNCPSDDIV